jgi:predicted DNA-binding transcriptional regulator AlpA
MAIQQRSHDVETPVLLEPEVCHRTRLSPSTIRRLELRGAFPRRRMLSPWRVGWLTDEINAWIQSRQAVPLHG